MIETVENWKELLLQGFHFLFLLFIFYSFTSYFQLTFSFRYFTSFLEWRTDSTFQLVKKSSSSCLRPPFDTIKKCRGKFYPVLSFVPEMKNFERHKKLFLNWIWWKIHFFNIIKVSVYFLPAEQSLSGRRRSEERWKLFLISFSSFSGSSIAISITFCC